MALFDIFRKSPRGKDVTLVIDAEDPRLADAQKLMLTDRSFRITPHATTAREISIDVGGLPKEEKTLVILANQVGRQVGEMLDSTGHSIQVELATVAVEQMTRDANRTTTQLIESVSAEASRGALAALRGSKVDVRVAEQKTDVYELGRKAKAGEGGLVKTETNKALEYRGTLPNSNVIAKLPSVEPAHYKATVRSAASCASSVGDESSAEYWSKEGSAGGSIQGSGAGGAASISTTISGTSISSEGGALWSAETGKFDIDINF